MYAPSAQPQPVKWPQLINCSLSCLFFFHTIRVEYVFSNKNNKNNKKQQKKNNTVVTCSG